MYIPFCIDVLLFLNLYLFCAMKATLMNKTTGKQEKFDTRISFRLFPLDGGDAAPFFTADGCSHHPLFVVRLSLQKLQPLCNLLILSR